MKTYACQGGTSAILVFDDGMRCLESKEQQDERISFYANHNISWVARPKHDDSLNGFHRAGWFKKASNLNYGTVFSMKLEKHLASLQQVGGQDADDEGLKDRALKMAIEETFAETKGRWRPWAANGKSCGIGPIVLLIDADTIVPDVGHPFSCSHLIHKIILQDCFRDAVREFAESPDVAIIQHESEIMTLTDGYIENGIAEYTRRGYDYVSVSAANGDIPHFFGHNAFIRWSALQEAAFVDKHDGVLKIWSESDVIEDSELALRLQTMGYVIRWVTYSHGGFKEGVPLTVDDEIARWQRFSFGWSYLTLNPLSAWMQLGPINEKMWAFCRSNVPLNHKITTIINLVGFCKFRNLHSDIRSTHPLIDSFATYMVAPLVCYLILGFTLDLDWYRGFNVWLASKVVLPLARSMCSAIYRYRTGKGRLAASILEGLKWTPFLYDLIPFLAPVLLKSDFFILVFSSIAVLVPISHFHLLRTYRHTPSPGRGRTRKSGHSNSSLNFPESSNASG